MEFRPYSPILPLLPNLSQWVSYPTLPEGGGSFQLGHSAQKRMGLGGSCMAVLMYNGIVVGDKGRARW